MKGLNAPSAILASALALSATAACDAQFDQNQSGVRQTVAGALTIGESRILSNNCNDFTVIDDDVVCGTFYKSQPGLTVIKDFTAGISAPVTIQNSGNLIFPVGVGKKIVVSENPTPELTNSVYDLNVCDLGLDSGKLANCSSFAKQTVGTSDRSHTNIVIDGVNYFLSLDFGQKLSLIESSDNVSKIALVGFPDLTIQSVHPYEGDDIKGGNVVVTMLSPATGNQAITIAIYDPVAKTLTKVGPNYKSTCVKTGSYSEDLQVLKVNGEVFEMENCHDLGAQEINLTVTKLSGDTPVPDKDPVVDAGVIEDTKDDTVPDSTDANDIGPGEVDAVGDAVPDGVDTDDNGSTEDVKPDLSQPDAEVQELPQEEVSSPDAEIDNGEEVTDAMTDGDGGEGPDVVEVSETDGSNGPDATPDVVVKNVCEQLGAVVNQPQVTLSVENGECVVTTENADGEVRVDFIGGDATGFITVKPKNAGEVARFSDGATSIPTGSVLNGLNATLTGSGTIEDGLNGGFMSSAVPGAKTTTTVIGGANVGDVPNGTTIKTVDGVTEVTAGPTDGVRVIATCLSNGKIIDIQLEAGESNKKDPCAEDVIPPKPSSGGGCNVAGEGNHKNGVGDLGAELLLGLVGLFAVNRRRLAKVLGFA